MKPVKVLLTLPCVMLLVVTKTFGWSDAMNDKEKNFLTLYGWFVGEQLNLKECNFSKDEFKSFSEGIYMSIQGKSTPITEAKDVDNMKEFINKRNAEYRQKRDKINSEIAKINNMKTQEFTEKLDKNPDVKSTKTGLRYIIKNIGNENKPDANDTVLVHYIGTLLDGSEFDSSVRRGTPAQFRLDQVVPGFSEGLQQIGENGEATLYIPAKLGYGNHDVAGIPVGSMIIFEVKLLKVTKSPGTNPKNIFE